jgi:hypothetical protein
MYSLYEVRYLSYVFRELLTVNCKLAEVLNIG